MNPLLLLSIAALTLAPAYADTAKGDAAGGKRIAEKSCAGCHQIAPDAKGASSDAPAFAEIAKRLPNEADKVATFIQNPAPPMPKVDLSQQDIADVLAFIATQKG